jgi:hypothetical protein
MAASMPDWGIPIAFSSMCPPAFINVEHSTGDATRDILIGAGMSPQDFASVRAQTEIAGDGCIYAGLGFSDGGVIRTAVGDYLCKSHHWDRR